MGTPVVPLELGLDCSLCFPPGFTPKYIYAVFEGILMCPGGEPWPLAPETPFKMEQSTENPCAWDNYPSEWLAVYQIFPTWSWLYFQNVILGVEYFSGQNDLICYPKFTNLHTDEICFTFPGYPYGGTARVYYDYDPIPGILCESMGFHPGEKNLSHKTP
jgi:hypothetical protein